MSCQALTAPTVSSSKELSFQSLKPIVGILAITILDFTHEKSSSFSLFQSTLTDVSLKLSNQQKKVKVLKTEEDGQEVYSTDMETFIINDSHLTEGRMLSIDGYDKNFLFTTYMGSASVNIDSILKEDGSQECECDLVEDGKNKGKLKLRITFIPEQYEFLSFKFTQALIISKEISATYDKDYFVQVEIGEQILKTQEKPEGRTFLPQWKDNILTFAIPNIVEVGRISLFAIEDKKLITVGSCEVDLKDIIMSRKRKFSEDISQENKITGNLEFCTAVGAEPEFIEQCRMKKYSLKIKPNAEENIHELRKINSHALFNKHC